jgi:hypothetical protein
MWISWRREYSPGETLTFEDKVEVFYEQTIGWQLHIADLIANGGTTYPGFKPYKPEYSVPNIRHSGFAVLHICLSYLELIGSLVIPSKSSTTESFQAGIRDVFPDLLNNPLTKDKMFWRLYDGARCGLYHEGRTRPGVCLGQPSDGSAIAYDSQNDVIVISPERLPPVLKEHLEQFKKRLLDTANVELRHRFEHRFDTGFTRGGQGSQKIRKCKLCSR